MTASSTPSPTLVVVRAITASSFIPLTRFSVTALLGSVYTIVAMITHKYPPL